MKKLSLIVSIFTCSLYLQAQPKLVYDYLKSADEYYAKGNYYSAATYYEKYVALNSKEAKPEGYSPYAATSVKKSSPTPVSNKQQAYYRLAECYRLLNLHEKAEQYYKEASSFDKATYPLAPYWYGKTLRALGKYAAADSALNSFVAAYPNEDKYKEDAQRETKNIQFVQKQMGKKDLGLYTVNKGNDKLNAKGSNASPMWAGKNTLIFTSSRLDSTAPKNKQHINKLYVATYSDGVANAVTPLSIEQPKDVHQGASTTTPDGKTMFLTRWSFSNKHQASAIYTSKQNADGSWSNPVMLDTSFNIPGTNNKEPFVMPDGKHLLFSSDRAGGIGGFDLWAIDLDGTGAISGAASNLGATVNTKWDERAPYYHAASQSLIFSSNGHVGMGGLDFFQSKGQLAALGTPTNLGYPLNSIKDDIYFISNGSAKNVLGDVVFSSDRSSECCLDLFNLSKQRLPKSITGSVLDCDSKTPIAGAQVQVLGDNNKVVASQTTGADGTYAFKLEDFQQLTAAATANGYNAGSVTVSIPANDDDEAQQIPTLCLTKPEPPKPPTAPKVDTVIVMDNIYFDFNSARVKTESGSNIDMQVVQLLQQYPTMQLEIAGHTDAMGDAEYNMDLSNWRAEAVKKYLVEKGIDPNRLTTVGYGETKPIAPNTTPAGKDNPEGRAKNRRIEFRVLGYK